MNGRGDKASRRLGLSGSREPAPGMALAIPGEGAEEGLVRNETRRAADGRSARGTSLELGFRDNPAARSSRAAGRVRRGCAGSRARR